MKNLENKKIIISSHVGVQGPPLWDLEDFLKTRVKSLAIFGFPFSHSPIQKTFFKKYAQGELSYKKQVLPLIRKDFYLYFRDFLLSFLWSFQFGKVDLFIGINNLNAAVGILLKKIGMVEYVVYYTIDYNPQRFSNKLLNHIYHSIDLFCVRNVDCVWNLSEAMVWGREKKGIEKKYRKKQIVVPIGVNKSSMPKNNKEIHMHKIAYMGHLRKGQGVEFLLKAFPAILKKVPTAKLAIFGGGPLLDKLKTKAIAMNLVDKIFFSGFVKEPKELEEMLSYSQIAVAPYEDTPENFTRYTDPGKPKTYLSLGIPIVIVKVPQFALTIDRKKAGIATRFDQGEFVDAIVSLLNNREKWVICRKNALMLSQEFLWDDIFEKALSKL